MKHLKPLLPLALGAGLLVFFFVAGGADCLSLTRRDDILVAVSITSQPQGGSGVNTVSCTFDASLSRTDGKTEPLEVPASIYTTWYSTHGQYNHETHKLYNPGQTQSFTVSKSAPTGMCLDKPFWLEISWYDTDDHNLMYSDTAYCE